MQKKHEEFEGDRRRRSLKFQSQISLVRREFSVEAAGRWIFGDATSAKAIRISPNCASAGRRAAERSGSSGGERLDRRFRLAIARIEKKTSGRFESARAGVSSRGIKRNHSRLQSTAPLGNKRTRKKELQSAFRFACLRFRLFIHANESGRFEEPSRREMLEDVREETSNGMISCWGMNRHKLTRIYFRTQALFLS